MEVIKNFIKKYPFTTLVIVVFVIYLIYRALKGKKAFGTESSFTPTPGAPRGVFAPIPPAPAPAPVTPPPAPSEPSITPTPGSGSRDWDHHHRPYPYPYPYYYPYQYSTVYLLDNGDTDVARANNICYQKIADSRGDLTICVTRREYIIYLKGRLDFWKERLKTAVKNMEFSNIKEIYAKISRIKTILESEGV